MSVNRKIFSSVKIVPFIYSGLLAFLLLQGCNSKKHELKQNNINTDKNEIQNIRRFEIKKNDSCTLLTIINPWQGASSIRHNYYLVNREQNLSFPDSLKNYIINVPVRNIICTSTTHLAMISALNEQLALSGFSGTAFIYNAELKKLYESGKIKNIGDETGFNFELILSLSPELIMLYGVDNTSISYLNMFHEAGIKTIFNADFLEEDPLGKAEWIKVFGALFCKEELADSIYNSVADSYMKIRDFVHAESNSAPSVLLGLPFRDTWYISPGNSYAARLITDAGGTYLWSNTRSSESMPLSLESVYLKALGADFWLNTGAANSVNEISSIDIRLSQLPCFKNGNLYNNNNIVSQSGGNDYWESGILNPHKILLDIATILHPELFNKHDLYYYKKIK